MRTYIKVFFEDGDHLETWINLPESEAKEYYLGKLFNIGSGPNDNIKECVRVEIL